MIYVKVLFGKLILHVKTFTQKDKEKAQEKLKQKQHKTCGYSEQGYYEAIYHEGKPAFLTINKTLFHIYDEVTTDVDSFLPKEYPNEFPYEPYGYFEKQLPTDEVLYGWIRAEFDLFLDLESCWKDYLAACVLLSYQQEKMRTVPYVYFVGDNESGKTVALNLFNWLCYRPMLGVTIPPADVYGYLDDSDAPGTILEDEAQGLNKDQDKAKIYKAGYKKSSVVPRTMITQNKRFIKYFRVFCFKACAAEELPRVKGLLERFIFISMTEGYPKKDWADLNKVDEQRFRDLRNALLKWRLITKETEFAEVELPVKGRLKELWKPIIQVTAGLSVEEKLRTQIVLLQKERLNEKTGTLEGHIVKAVCSLYKPDVSVAFNDIWNWLVDDLDGKLDDKKPNKMDTSEFGDVTKQKVGYRLREVLNGKKVKTRLPAGSAYVYDFDVEKLGRVAKKYGCGSVLKFSSVQSSDEQSLVKSEKQVGEKGIFSENTPILRIEKIEIAAESRVDVGVVENSRTELSFEEFASKVKGVVRLTTDFGVERCVCCGVSGRADWQVDLFDASWKFLCGDCGLRLSEKLSRGGFDA
jgi:hypothetical protein